MFVPEKILRRFENRNRDMKNGLKEEIKRVFGEGVKFHVSMSDYTTIGTGGRVEAMVTVESRESLVLLIRLLEKERVPWMVVGEGSNLIVRDGGIDGVVVILAGEFERIESRGGEVIAGAGMKVSRLLSFLLKNELSGLEFMAGIPGTIGGAIKGNAGAKGLGICDRVSWMEVLLLPKGVFILPSCEMGYSYRRLDLKEGSIILRASFRLGEGKREDMKREMRDLLIRRKKTQPRGKTAGCIFKNPGSVSAGRIIDELGLSGVRLRRARISPLHANFIENLGDTDSRDIIALITMVKEKVLKERGIELEEEVVILGKEG